jgi:hypothetical protein
MSSTLEELLQEAETWLASQPTPGPLEVKMFRTFISAAKVEPSGAHLRVAIKALNHHLVDSGDYGAEHFKAISSFLDRADRLARDETS